jgi:hypothetical protein
MLGFLPVVKSFGSLCFVHFWGGAPDKVTAV